LPLFNGFCDDNTTRSPQGGNTLTKQALWKQITKRIASIEQNIIEITPDRPMLESIIQNKMRGRWPRDRREITLNGLPATGPDDDRNIRQRHRLHPRLVSDRGPWSVTQNHFSVLNNLPLSRSQATTVSTCDNRWPAT
jgi:hypothetical protein